MHTWPGGAFLHVAVLLLVDANVDGFQSGHDRQLYGTALLPESNPNAHWESSNSGELHKLLGRPWARCSRVDGARGCRARGVCFSNVDGTLVPELPKAVDPSQNAVAAVHKSYGGLTSCRKPKTVPHSVVSKWRSVRVLNGTTLVANCWRKKLHPSHINPAHFLMGYSNLFVLAAQAAKGGALPISNIILHQCPSFKESDWTTFVWHELTKRFEEQGVWLSETLVGIYIFSRSTATFPPATKAVVCARDILQQPYDSGMYFGGISNKLLGDWFAHGPAAAHQRQSPPTPPLTKPVTNKAAIKGCKATCTQNLRVGVFQRAAGEGASRTLVNLNEVKALVQRYTVQPVVDVLNRHSDTGADQARMFYKTDILISTHGSQLANMVFAPNLTVIEVVVYPQEKNIFCLNAHRLLKHGEIMSYGHFRVRPDGSNDMIADKHVAACTESKNESLYKTCKRDRNTDIRVKLDRLELDLQRALEVQCGCAAIEATSSECPSYPGYNQGMNSSRYIMPPASRIL